ncbi:hypothetical protein [Alkalicoccobacillus porphyridii]|uniref:Uncharacterized protein n=1 Tax=Alkalicoccobacillus porphyridii TaxID=2597270 RepID=A0A553ZX66_9BACI|nr:hypothetical protein [Alkalicoccobacillus porphyridii]TSB46049.1 hypothetical protein FN960_14220 [Alkalicoccobacillus porphyridii]
MEQPPFIREQGTYKDFLFFPQPFTYENDFFYSERKEGKEEIDRWIANEKAGEADFPRRLFLYRTFMQAMHIKQVAKEASGKVVLVVVGHMHKHDIENILKENEDIELVQSSSYGYPSDQEINNNIEQMDRSFILAFNLLGVQASHGVDWDWMRVLIEEFQGNIAETILFQTRLDVLTNKITPEAAIHQYQTALDSVEDNKRFSFQRDVEGDRVDTYYDPFGGVSIKIRLFIELAREYYKLSHLQRVEELKEHILNLDEMNSLKKLQIQGYWEKHLLGES